jgi:single-stranded DNA-binding protein
VITISAIGRLMQAPEARQTATGAAMATAQLAVKPKAEGDAVPIDLIAFGSVAKALAEHQQGDLVQLFGRLQWNQWKDRAGVDHAGWGIVADQLMSARNAGSWQRHNGQARPRRDAAQGGWEGPRQQRN